MPTCAHLHCHLLWPTTQGFLSPPVDERVSRIDAIFAYCVMLHVLACEETVRKHSQNANSRLRDKSETIAPTSKTTLSVPIWLKENAQQINCDLYLSNLFRGNPVNNVIHFAVGFIDCVVLWQASVCTDQGLLEVQHSEAVDGIWYAACAYVFELDLSSSTIVCLCTGLRNLLGWTEAGKKHLSHWQLWNFSCRTFSFCHQGFCLCALFRLCVFFFPWKFIV